jgi:hypothetical protein
VNTTSYVVSLTVYNACGDADTYTRVLGDVLGAPELVFTDIKVYPNPATSVLVLESASAVKGKVSLTDALGRTVVEFDANGDTQQQVDVSGLSAGMYVLRIIHNGQFFQDRIQVIK